MNIAVVEDDSARNRALCQMAGELSGEGAQIFLFPAVCQTSKFYKW